MSNEFMVSGIKWKDIHPKYKYVLVMGKKVYASTHDGYLQNETELLYLGEQTTTRPRPSPTPKNINSISDIKDSSFKKMIIGEVREYVRRQLVNSRYTIDDTTLTLTRCSQWGDVSAVSLINDIAIPFIEELADKVIEVVFSNDQCTCISIKMKKWPEKLSLTCEYESWVKRRRYVTVCSYLHNIAIESANANKLFENYAAKIQHISNDKHTITVDSVVYDNKEIPADVISVYFVELLLRDQGIPYKVTEYGPAWTYIEIYPHLTEAVRILKELTI